MAENLIASENVDSDVLIDKIAEKLESVTRLDSSKPPSFSDLPNEILGPIVEKLDLMSRMSTRKVSRRLRTVVDKQKAEYGKISIYARKDHVHITVDEEVMIHYCKSGGCLIHTDYEESVKHKFIKGDNFLEIALNDLSIALKEPKFQLGCLALFLIGETPEAAKILKFIESLKSPIHLKFFVMTSNGKCDILPILSLLKPGTLEYIVIKCVDTNLSVNQIVKMDQWKKAKRVQIEDIFERPIPVDIEDFIHFDSFTSHVESLSPKDVLRLRDAFSKSTNFESCSLQFSEDSANLVEIARALGATIVQTFFGPTIFHRHSIPGSKEFLVFSIDREALSIERKP